jgi:hypothetical protein
MKRKTVRWAGLRKRNRRYERGSRHFRESNTGNLNTYDTYMVAGEKNGNGLKDDRQDPQASITKPVNHLATT